MSTEKPGQRVNWTAAGWGLASEFLALVAVVLISGSQSGVGIAGGFLIFGAAALLCARAVVALRARPK